MDDPVQRLSMYAHIYEIKINIFTLKEALKGRVHKLIIIFQLRFRSIIS